MNGDLTIAFVGNPNCGKTTLFNAYTGARLKVANLPGVTVEKKEGTLEWRGRHCRLVDLPGLYSLEGYTMEEEVSRAYLQSDEVDLIVNVVDASSLERSLYLTTELAVLDKPIVLALNMIDIIEKRGMMIDQRRLSASLGLPVVTVSGRSGRGLDRMMDTVLSRWQARTRTSRSQKKSLSTQEIAQNYAQIESIVSRVLMGKAPSESLTDRLDRLLTHRFWGFPIFALIVLLVFVLTFTVGGFLKEGLTLAITRIADGLRSLLLSARVAKPIVSLVTDGLIAGVGSTLAFLPSVAILYLLLALLEDSGYMARIAYLADRLMSRFGLSGRAFLPMLLGFGCTVPAVMATRILEEENDRKRTILALPFISCSARLPVYLLLSEIFFDQYAPYVACSLILIGLLASLGCELLCSKLSRQTEPNGLLIELPDYKLPSPRTVAICVWERVSGYLVKAGTVIFLASIVLWFLQSFNMSGMCALSDSFAASLGRGLAPLLAPCGLGYWQIALSLIAGLAGKEVIVSALGVLYGAGSVGAGAGGGIAALGSALASAGFGAANAYAMMLFVLLYTPCAAALTAIYRETRSLRWTLASLSLQMGSAWAVSAIFYQIALLFP